MLRKPGCIIHVRLRSILFIADDLADAARDDAFCRASGCHPAIRRKVSSIGGRRGIVGRWAWCFGHFCWCDRLGKVWTGGDRVDGHGVACGQGRMVW